MSKKQTLSNTNYSSPDWLTIREAVEVINKKGLEIKKSDTDSYSVSGNDSCFKCFRNFYENNANN